MALSGIHRIGTYTVFQVADVQVYRSLSPVQARGKLFADRKNRDDSRARLIPFERPLPPAAALRA